MINHRVLLFLLLSGCAHMPQPSGALHAPGVDRLYCVESDTACRLYRSAQPEDDASIPVDAIIKLNSSVEHREHVGAAQDLYQHPWLPAGPVLHAEVEVALGDVERALAEGKRVLVHCTEGRDRTGLLIALWRVRHGVLPAAAFGEWIRYGSHRFHYLEEAFERETGYHP